MTAQRAKREVQTESKEQGKLSSGAGFLERLCSLCPRRSFPRPDGIKPPHV